MGSMPVAHDDETSEIVLRLSAITKRFGSLVANDAISFELTRGEVVALLGENGAGKTTLMNILFGHYVADEGTVEVFGRRLTPGESRAALNAGIGMVHQHFTLANDMSVLENITLGTEGLARPALRRAAARRRIAKLSRDFGLAVDPDRKVASLSVGERQRAEILKALYRDARILILDEPTAVLTPLETEALFGTLKMLVSEGLSVIFISHKLNEVLTASDRVIVLRNGRIAGRLRTADTTRAELAELMVGRELVSPSVAASNPGSTLLSLEKVSTAPGPGGCALHAASLVLREGQITGLAGVSGNGQTAIEALVAGIQKPTSGCIMLKGEAVDDWSPRTAIMHGVGRIPEDRHSVGTIGDMSVTENLISERYHTPRFSRRGFLDWRRAREFAQAIIGNYGVKCPSPETRVRLLSGGNMQKLILGRALDSEPRIILASQPTQGLDVGAISYVHDRLLDARAWGAAILLISEDLDEILMLADQIVVISQGRLSEPSARGQRSVGELGELMAGHGIPTLEAGHAA